MRAITTIILLLSVIFSSGQEHRAEMGWIPSIYSNPPAYATLMCEMSDSTGHFKIICHWDSAEVRIVGDTLQVIRNMARTIQDLEDKIEHNWDVIFALHGLLKALPQTEHPTQEQYRIFNEAYDVYKKTGAKWPN